MKKENFIPLFLLVVASNIFCSAQTNPVITRYLQNTTVMGRHYVSGNSTPIQDAVLANVQSVKYSSSWVYITTNGIPTYVTGPYLDGNPSIATSQNAIFKIPLGPTQNTGTATATTGGNIGIFINGVAFFDYRDGASWKSSTGAMAGGPYGGTGDGVWNRDAVVGERAGFDCSKGHPAMGNYHHHQNPGAFRLDLNVISTVCNLYTSDGLYAIDSTQHSPLIGFAYDGFPVYGAYGYKNADGTGGIVRMKSSYGLRNITIRNTYSTGQSVTAGPAVSASYPLGYFREDYQYNTTSAATPEYLDEHNGRFCITPEYPTGIYCYFATVDANWNSSYPYLVGPTFYGNKTALKVASIAETVTTYSPSTAPAIYIAASAKTICSGMLVSFTSATYNGGVSPAYQWKRNGSNVGINSNSYSSDSLANGDVISCVVTTASSGTAASNNITMTVTSSVTPAVAISAASSMICTGTNVTFTATPSNGGAAPSYQWKKNGNNVGMNSVSYSDNALLNGDVISCVMTGNAACSSSPTATSNSITMTVNANVTPSVAISTGAVTICTGTDVTFTAVPTNGGLAPSYQWKKNGINVGSNSVLYTDSTLSTGNVIQCIMTSNATCGSPLTASSNSLSITTNCTSVALNLKLFIEGFYIGNGAMVAVADPANYPSLCDTITVHLHNSATYETVYSAVMAIDVNGNGSVVLPSAYYGNQYYISVKHRNIIETWSLSPVSFGTATVSYDFTR